MCPLKKKSVFYQCWVFALQLSISSKKLKMSFLSHASLIFFCYVDVPSMLERYWYLHLWLWNCQILSLIVKFCFVYLKSLLLDAYTFIIVISSWANGPSSWNIFYLYMSVFALAALWLLSLIKFRTLPDIFLHIFFPLFLFYPSRTLIAHIWIFCISPHFTKSPFLLFCFLD